MKKPDMLTQGKRICQRKIDARTEHDPGPTSALPPELFPADQPLEGKDKHPGQQQFQILVVVHVLFLPNACAPSRVQRRRAYISIVSSTVSRRANRYSSSGMSQRRTPQVCWGVQPHTPRTTAA